MVGPGRGGKEGGQWGRKGEGIDTTKMRSLAFYFATKKKLIFIFSFLFAQRIFAIRFKPPPPPPFPRI